MQPLPDPRAVWLKTPRALAPRAPALAEHPCLIDGAAPPPPAAARAPSPTSCAPHAFPNPGICNGGSHGRLSDAFLSSSPLTKTPPTLSHRSLAPPPIGAPRGRAQDPPRPPALTRGALRASSTAQRGPVTRAHGAPAPKARLHSLPPSFDCPLSAAARHGTSPQRPTTVRPAAPRPPAAAALLWLLNPSARPQRPRPPACRDCAVCALASPSRLSTCPCAPLPPRPAVAALLHRLTAAGAGAARQGTPPRRAAQTAPSTAPPPGHACPQPPRPCLQPPSSTCRPATLPPPALPARRPRPARCVRAGGPTSGLTCCYLSPPAGHWAPPKASANPGFPGF